MSKANIKKIMYIIYIIYSILVLILIIGLIILDYKFIESIILSKETTKLSVIVSSLIAFLISNITIIMIFNAINKMRITELELLKRQIDI